MLMRSFFVDAGFELPPSPVLVGDADDVSACSFCCCCCCCGCFLHVHFPLRQRCSFVFSYLSRFASRSRFALFVSCVAVWSLIFDVLKKQIDQKRGFEKSNILQKLSNSMMFAPDWFEDWCSRFPQKLKNKRQYWKSSFIGSSLLSKGLDRLLRTIAFVRWQFMWFTWCFKN